MSENLYQVGLGGYAGPKHLKVIQEASHTKKKCYICGGPDEQICIVCERNICQKCIAPDILPGDSCICLECDPITPDRAQAHRHYWKRVGIRIQNGEKL